MDIVISAKTTDLVIPINLLFWGYLAVYVIHILEESLLGETFVEKMKTHIWPDYGWKHFFGFNTMLLSLYVIAVISFESVGGAWIIFPLSLAMERTLNGFWHLGESIIRRRFSSGLLSSVLVWILTYLIVRYSLIRGEIGAAHFVVSTLTGAAITGLMMGSMLVFRRKYGKGRMRIAE
jgi:hypothetical protein